MTNTGATVAVPPGAGGEDIRGIKPPVPIPTVWSWLGPLLIGLALLALAAVLVRWWLRRRRRAAAKPMVKVPAHVRAKERLRAALELLGQPKPFCISISDSLRWYLEERFHLRAPERTTEEFLNELQSSPRLDLRQKGMLDDFLTRCDLVKFARYEPGESELRGLWEAAVRLVEETAEPGVTAAEGERGEASGVEERLTA